MRLFGRRASRRDDEPDGRVDFLVIGLGNPGSRYAGTRHNVGFDVAERLAERWQLPRPRKKFGGLLAEGRAGAGGPRVAVLWPQTFMNESGRAAGPARGSLGVALDRVVALHDEIDLPFGEIRSKLGGGVAGHNGLKSLDRGLGSRDFWRVRVGVGRPEGTDPEIVSRHVLGRFSEDREQVGELIDSAVGETGRLLERLAAEDEGEGGGADG